MLIWISYLLVWLVHKYFPMSWLSKWLVNKYFPKGWLSDNLLYCVYCPLSKHDCLWTRNLVSNKLSVIKQNHFKSCDLNSLHKEDFSWEVINGCDEHSVIVLSYFKISLVCIYDRLLSIITKIGINNKISVPYDLW